MISRFMEAKGWKRAVLTATTDATGQDTEGRFVDEFAPGKYPGMQLVTREHFAQNDPTVAAQIAKMQSFSPDVIIDATTGTATGTVLRGPGFISHDVTPKGPIRDAQQLFYTTASAEQVLEYIESLKHFPASDGYYDYTDGSQRGIGIDSIVICQWDPLRKTWVAASEPGGKPLPKR